MIWNSMLCVILSIYFDPVADFQYIFRLFSPFLFSILSPSWSDSLFLSISRDSPKKFTCNLTIKSKCAVWLFSSIDRSYKMPTKYYQSSHFRTSDWPSMKSLHLHKRLYNNGILFIQKQFQQQQLRKRWKKRFAWANKQRDEDVQSFVSFYWREKELMNIFYYIVEICM